MNNHENEARSRWGDTAAWHEHTEKTKNYTKKDRTEASEGLMAYFADFASCKSRGIHADSAKAQKIAAGLQAYITEHFYTCTDEILAGLGRMYLADDRFRENIDKKGAGTAEFAACAIKAYCKERSGK